MNNTDLIIINESLITEGENFDESIKQFMDYSDDPLFRLRGKKTSGNTTPSSTTTNTSKAAKIRNWRRKKFKDITNSFKDTESKTNEQGTPKTQDVQDEQGTPKTQDVQDEQDKQGTPKTQDVQDEQDKQGTPKTQDGQDKQNEQGTPKTQDGQDKQNEQDKQNGEEWISGSDTTKRPKVGAMIYNKQKELVGYFNNIYGDKFNYNNLTNVPVEGNRGDFIYKAKDIDTNSSSESIWVSIDNKGFLPKEGATLYEYNINAIKNNTPANKLKGVGTVSNNKNGNLSYTQNMSDMRPQAIIPKEKLYMYLRSEAIDVLNQNNNNQNNNNQDNNNNNEQIDWILGTDYSKTPKKKCEIFAAKDIVDKNGKVLVKNGEKVGTFAGDIAIDSTGKKKEYQIWGGIKPYFTADEIKYKSSDSNSTEKFPLKLGSSGEEVKQLQRALGIKIDGNFDETTEQTLYNTNGVKACSKELYDKILNNTQYTYGDNIDNLIPKVHARIYAKKGNGPVNLRTEPYVDNGLWNNIKGIVDPDTTKGFIGYVYSEPTIEQREEGDNKIWYKVSLPYDSNAEMDRGYYKGNESTAWVRGDNIYWSSDESDKTDENGKRIQDDGKKETKEEIDAERNKKIEQEEQQKKQESESREDKLTLNKENLAKQVGDNSEFNVVIERYKEGIDPNNHYPYTIGKLYINGQPFGYTIEDYDFNFHEGDKDCTDKYIKSIKGTSDKGTNASHIIFYDNNKRVNKEFMSCKGHMAIQTGTFPLSMTQSSHFTKRTKENKYPEYVYGKETDSNGNIIQNRRLNGSVVVPLVENVTGWSGVRVHYGYNNKFSDGCILICKNEPKNGFCSPDDALATYHDFWNRLMSVYTYKGAKHGFRTTNGYQPKITINNDELNKHRTLQYKISGGNLPKFIREKSVK